MTRTYQALLLACLLLLALLGGGCGNRTSKAKDIHIAAVLPLTGSLQFFGQPEQVVLRMATDEANARGGVGGRKVSLSIEDSKGTAKDGASATQKALLANPAAVITSLTVVSNAAAPLLKSRHKMQVAQSVHPSLVSLSPYMVRPYYGFEQEVEVIADYLSKHGKKRVAALWIMVPECQTAINAHLVPALEASGATLVASENYGFAEKSLRPQLAKIAARKPDAVIVMDFGTLMAPILRECAALGLRDKVIANVGLLTAPPIDKTLLQGVRVVGPAFVISRSPAYATFSAKLKARGIDASYDVAYTYDGFSMLLRSLAAAGDSGDPVKAFKKLEPHRGVTGVIYVKPDGNVTTEIAVGVYRDGQLTPVKA